MRIMDIENRLAVAKRGKAGEKGVDGVSLGLVDANYDIYDR